VYLQVFFKENIMYVVWTFRDPISLILETRFSLILGTWWWFLSDYREQILNSRDPNRVPKTPKKTWYLSCTYPQHGKDERVITRKRNWYWLLFQDNNWNCANSAFKSRVRHFFCRTFQSYNSPGDWARELFKPSTDSVSLLVEIEKKFFVYGGVFSGGTATSGGVFAFFLATFGQPWTPTHWIIILEQDCLETRPKSASLEPLNDFLAYL